MVDYCNVECELFGKFELFPRPWLKKIADCHAMKSGLGALWRPAAMVFASPNHSIVFGCCIWVESAHSIWLLLYLHPSKRYHNCRIPPFPLPLFQSRLELQKIDGSVVHFAGKWEWMELLQGGGGGSVSNLFKGGKFLVSLFNTINFTPSQHIAKLWNCLWRKF